MSNTELKHWFLFSIGDNSNRRFKAGEILMSGNSKNIQRTNLEYDLDEHIEYYQPLPEAEEMNEIDYHCYDSCNKCGGVNEFDAVRSDSGHVEECETRCTICGFEDYWSYGFFESSQEIESKCNTYNFSQQSKPLPKAKS